MHFTMPHRLLASLALASVVSAAGCGGVDVQQIATHSPEAVLPGGAALAIGFELQSAQSHPLAQRLKALMDEEGRPPLMASALQGLGLENPYAQIQSAAWAAYEMQPGSIWRVTAPSPYGEGAAGIGLWAMAIYGDVNEQGVMAALQSPITLDAPVQIERSDLSGAPLLKVIRQGAQGPEIRFIAFPAPGHMLASSSEALMQKMMAVWQGRADGLLTDEAFAMTMRDVPTEAPVWIAGKGRAALAGLQISAGPMTRADSLGVGVDRFHATLTFSEDRLDVSAVFQCDNRDVATQLAANGEVLIKQMSMTRITGVALGLAASKATEIRTEGSDVLVEAGLTPEGLDAIEEEYAAARNANRQIQARYEELLRQKGDAVTEEDIMRLLMESGALTPPDATPLPGAPAAAPEENSGQPPVDEP